MIAFLRMFVNELSTQKNIYSSACALLIMFLVLRRIENPQPRKQSVFPCVREYTKHCRIERGTEEKLIFINEAVFSSPSALRVLIPQKIAHQR